MLAPAPVGASVRTSRAGRAPRTGRAGPVRRIQSASTTVPSQVAVGEQRGRGDGEGAGQVEEERREGDRPDDALREVAGHRALPGGGDRLHHRAAAVVQAEGEEGEGGGVPEAAEDTGRVVQRADELEDVRRPGRP